METKDFQIVIDLKDIFVGYSGYYGDEEDCVGNDVNDALKKALKEEVMQKLIKRFSPEVIKLLKDAMLEKFKDEFGNKVGDRIGRAIEHGVFSDKNNTFNVHQYVRQKFELAINNTTFSVQVDKLIKAQIQDMLKVLQERYDLEFASGIIRNLKEGGLLKEGAEKMLLK